MSQSASSIYSLSKREPRLISNQVFGMLIFVITEVMFFAALISAYMVIKAGSAAWQLPEGITLPVYATFINTLILLASGVSLVWAYRLMNHGAKAHLVRQYIFYSAILGSVFVGFQGYEWVRLITFGMTMKSGIFSACFFLLIGTHALHAFLGALYLFYYYFFTGRKGLSQAGVAALTIFWLFIVGVWPVLYGLVYF